VIVGVVWVAAWEGGSATPPAARICEDSGQLALRLGQEVHMRRLVIVVFGIAQLLGAGDLVHVGWLAIVVVLWLAGLLPLRLQFRRGPDQVCPPFALQQTCSGLLLFRSRLHHHSDTVLLEDATHLPILRDEG